MWKFIVVSNDFILYNEVFGDKVYGGFLISYSISNLYKCLLIY